MRDRVKCSLAVGAPLGADVWKNDKVSMRLQADFLNLNNRLNVIDFGALFSSKVIARLEATPCIPRSRRRRMRPVRLDCISSQDLPRCSPVLSVVIPLLDHKILCSRMMHHDRGSTLLRFE